MSLEFNNNQYLFNILSEKAKKEISSKVFKKNEIVYHQGDEPQHVYEVTNGHVGLISISHDGKEILLRVFNKGQFFGHRTLLSNETYHATTIALTNTQVKSISRRDFEAEIQTNNESLLYITQVLAKELRRSENKFAELATTKVEARILQTLAFLRTRYPNYQWTRKEVGEYCGAKTETVSRILTKAHNEGLISKDGRKINIVDLEKLYEFAENLKA